MSDLLLCKACNGTGYICDEQCKVCRGLGLDEREYQEGDEIHE